jgi:hypothetical protein
MFLVLIRLKFCLKIIDTRLGAIENWKVVS